MYIQEGETAPYLAFNAGHVKVILDLLEARLGTAEHNHFFEPNRGRTP